MRQPLVWLVNHPLACLIAVLVMVAAAGLNIHKLILDPGSEGLIIPGPDKQFYQATKETFGGDVLLSVVVDCDNVFHKEILSSIDRLTDALDRLTLTFNGKEIHVTSSVMSLTTVNKIDGRDGELDVALLIDEIPDDERELDLIRKNALNSETIVGDLISIDGRTAAINAHINTVPKGYVNYDMDITRKVEGLIAAEKSRLAGAGVQADVFQVGGPLVTVRIAEDIDWNMKYCTSFAILLLLVTLWVSFRSPLGMIIPVTTGGLSVICVLGFMAYMGYAINAISSIVPLIMIVVGSTEDVYLIAKYIREARQTDTKIEAIQNMMAKSGLAILLTTFTTVFGFVALSVNRISLLKELGISVAFGLSINFVLTLLIVPTILRYAPIPRDASMRRRNKRHRLFQTIAEFLHGLALRKRSIIVILAMLMITMSVIGATRIRVDTDRVSFFKKNSDILQRLNLLHERLSGGQNFLIIVDAGDGEGVKSHRTMAAIAALQERMKGVFDKSVSVADYIKMMNRAMHDNDPAYFSVPDSSELIAQYLLMLEGDEMERLLESTYSRASIMVRHNLVGSWRIDRELEKVRAWATELFPRHVRVKITGSSIVANAAARSMSVGAVQGLAMAIVVIFFVISLLFYSFKAGFLAMIPNLVPITLGFGVMGWTGITLNPATATVAVIVLGIAVDDTIHLMTAFHKALKGTIDQSAAMLSALRSQIQPVISTSVGLTLGFSVLVFSRQTCTVEFGYLAGIAMVSAALCDLLVTPALLAYTHLVTPWDMLRLKISPDFTQKSLLFHGLKLREIKKVALSGVLTKYATNQPIIHKGDHSREMYLILRGEAAVFVPRDGQNREVNRMRRGDVFGEMALVTGEERSADVVAVEEMELLRINEESLDRVRFRSPRIAAKLFYNLSAILSQRLKEKDKIFSPCLPCMGGPNP